MADKFVLFSRINVTEGFLFENLLIDTRFHLPIEEPAIEIKHIDSSNPNYIIGFFIKTVKTDIPPSHLPGEEEYSEIELPEGEGLAYPSVFLYCKRTKVLLFERNSRGVSESAMERYFNNKAVAYGLNLTVRFQAVINPDTYSRLGNFSRITEIEMQVATPIALAREYLEQNSSLGLFSKLVSSLNADSSAKIVFKADVHSQGLKIDQMLNLASFFNNNDHRIGNTRATNIFKVKGEIRNGLDENTVEEMVNFYSDRFITYFQLDENNRNFIHQTERATGILDCYDASYSKIVQIFGI